jgi:hypothetical protein
MSASKLQPALLGGAFIGVLSALPVVNLGNCCCLWVIGGGMLAAWLLQQNQPSPIESADGAIVGLLAGLIGAVIHLIVQIPIAFLLGPVQQEMMQRLSQQAGELPEELRPWIDNAAEGAALSAIGLAAGFVFMLVVGAIFSTLGGLLGAVLFRKQLPPPAPVDYPPPPPVLP